YGIINAGAGAVVYTATGGLGTGNWQWCQTGTLPSGFASTPSTNTTCTTAGASTEDTFKLSAATVGAGADTTSPYTTIAATLGDTGNVAVPDGFTSGSSTTSATSLTINPVLAAKFAQNGSNNPATLLGGVDSRTYGIINAGAGAVVYTATGGLGSGKWQWCQTGTLPGGFVSTPSTTTTCTTAGASTEDTFNLTASPVGATADTTSPYTTIAATLGDTG